MTPAVVALPALSIPITMPGDAPESHPVPPSIQTLSLRGVDPGALAEENSRDDTGGVPKGTPFVLTAKQSTPQFSALGVAWTLDKKVDDVEVHVRTHSKGGAWSDWEEVEFEANAGPDADTPEAAASSLRAGTDPLWVGDSDGVQVRVDAPADERPAGLDLSLVDPGTSPADEAVADPAPPGDAAEAAEPRPSYVSRAGWGADESLRSGSPSYSSTLKAGIIHNTATSNDYSASQVPSIMRSMYAYHTKTLGWSDLGYNFVVDKYGTLYEGRYGGVDKPVLGAHTGGFNAYTTGAAVIGNYDTAKPSSYALTKIEQLLAWKLGMYGRNPKGKVTLVSAGTSYTFYPRGTEVEANVISGHRDYSPKSCPGNNLYPLLPQIRDAVAARMGTTATKLSAAVSPPGVTYGSTVTVSGKLTTSAGSALGSRSVSVQVRSKTNTVWYSVGTATTASDGTWKISHKPSRNDVYRAKYAGSSTYSAVTSAEVGVAVKPAISLSLSSSKIAVGGSVTMSGYVDPDHEGDVVERQSFYNGAWHTVGTDTLGSTGHYSWTVTPPKNAGTHTLRVYKPADSDHGAAVSPTRTLSVS